MLLRIFSTILQFCFTYSIAVVHGTGHRDTNPFISQIYNDFQSNDRKFAQNDIDTILFVVRFLVVVCIIIIICLIVYDFILSICYKHSYSYILY